MKVFAARADRDRDDILSLCVHIGVASIQEVLDLTEDLYGDLVTPKSKVIAIEVLQDIVPMDAPLSRDMP
jgi:putative hemolysin